MKYITRDPITGEVNALLSGATSETEEIAADHPDVLAFLAALAPTYADLRRAEYPPIADLVDGLVKDDAAQVQAYKDACLAVKAKFPKP